MKSKQSVSLSGFSAIRIGGIAETVYFPETLDELVKLLTDKPEIKLVGGCTNTFFGYLPELICTKYLDKIVESASGIEAECGALLAELFDFSAGVPATVGGGVCMNFGAFGFELKDFLISARILQNGVIKNLETKDLDLQYRASNFQGIVLNAVFKKKQLENKSECLKQRQEKMPWGQPNLGSVFMNLQNQSAGKLIEQAGLKGYRHKDLQVSPKHANIIVNNGAATAEDLLFLINYIQETVKSKTGVELQTEIKYIG